jgi:hypothetical protein
LLLLASALYLLFVLRDSPGTAAVHRLGRDEPFVRPRGSSGLGGGGYSERRLCIDRKLPTSWGWAGEEKESWINQRACVDAVSQKERDPRGVEGRGMVRRGCRVGETSSSVARERK